MPAVRSIPPGYMGWPKAVQEDYYERLAICVHDGRMTIEEAEKVALADAKRALTERTKP